MASPQNASSPASAKPDASSVESAGDFTVFVEDLLQQMQTRFSELGNKINGRMDELGKRIDELEQHIGELVEEAGLDKQAILNNNGGSSSNHGYDNQQLQQQSNASASSPNLPKSPLTAASSKPKVKSTQIEI